jgi:CCR4-NOT transcription complex subunit 1
MNGGYKQVLSVDEAAVAEALGMMARTHEGLEEPHGLAAALGGLALGEAPGASQTWNVDAFVAGLTAACPELSWPTVLAKLDHDGFIVPNQKAFLLIAKAYRSATTEPPPLQVGCRGCSKAGLLGLQAVAASSTRSTTQQACS